MPIQNFHEDFLWHKIEACNVQQWGLYILRFNVDCHKWEFVPYGAVVWGVDIMDEWVLVAPVATCINFIGDYVQAQLVGWCVNVTISQPSCYPAPLSFDPLTSILYTNQGNACESSVDLSLLMWLMIEVTYAELQTLITDGDLIPGMKYKITDYVTTAFIGNTNKTATYTWTPEELVVIATSNNTISNEVKSMLYPQDDIWYDVNDNAIAWYFDSYYDSDWNDPDPYYNGTITLNNANSFYVQLPWAILFTDNLNVYGEDDSGNAFDRYYPWDAAEFTIVEVTPGSHNYLITLVNYTWDLSNFIWNWYVEVYWDMTIATRPGIITYRKDTIKHIETNYDFRNVKSRLYTYNLTLWTPWTYNYWNVVWHNWYIWACMYQTSEAPSLSAKHWILLDDQYLMQNRCPNQYWLTIWGSWLIPVNSAVYYDYYVFSTSDGNYWDIDVFWYKNTIPVNNYDYPVFVWQNTHSAWVIDSVELLDTNLTAFTQNTQTRNVKISNWSGNDFRWQMNHVQIDFAINNMISNWSNIILNQMLSCGFYNPNGISGNMINNSIIKTVQDLKVGNASSIFIWHWNWSTAYDLEFINCSWFQACSANQVSLKSLSYNLWCGKVYWLIAHDQMRDWSFDRADGITEAWSTLTWEFIGDSYTNTIHWSILWWTYHNFRQNEIVWTWQDNIISWLCQNNYINGQVINNVFNQFHHNGIWMNNITVNIASNVIWSFTSLACTYPLVTHEIANNILNLFDWVTIVSATPANIYFNSGIGLQWANVANIKHNNFVSRGIGALDTGTHIAANYWTIIQLNTNNQLQISWLDSVTGYNYDDITA